MYSLDQYVMAASRGNDTNIGGTRKFGRNTDVDTAAAEDIWDGGGVYVPPTVARVHAIVSGSALDDAGSTGATSVTIEGLDTNWDALSETVIMDGATPVNTVGSYLRVNRMYVATAGTGLVNAGIITATAAVDATVSAQISLGKGQTLQAVFSTAARFNSYITDLIVGVNRTSPAAQTCEASLWVRPGANVATAPWLQKSVFILHSESNVPYHHPFKNCPQSVPPMSDIKITCSVSANNFDISAEFCVTAIAG